MKFIPFLDRPRPSVPLFFRSFLKRGFNIFTLLFLLFGPGVNADVLSQVFFSDPENWQARIQLEFSPETLVREPELDRKLHKIFSSQATRQGAVYHLERHPAFPQGRAYTLSLEGAGGLRQLKKMLLLAADPTALPGDGPMSLELSGPIRTGASLPLSLEANPSTGFIWEISGLDHQKVRYRGGKALRAKSPLLGAPMTQTLFLEGIGDGETTIQVTYRRTWLADQAPVKKTKIQLPDLSLAADLDPPDPAPAAAEADPVPVANSAQPVLNLAGSFDWRNNNGQNALPSIRNQGSCGSCWAFGTVAPLESAIKIKQGLTVDLSEQYLVSCSFNESYDYGCNGGWFAHQYHQWKMPPGESATGAVQEAEFPYTGTDSGCTPPHAHHQKITNWSYVNPGNPYSIPAVDAIKNALAANGPLAAAVCAGPAMAAYRGGIFATDEARTVCGGGVNHAIVLVGWDDAEDTWIMRNSWGASWGESGYMRIKRNISNIGYAANYVTYDPPLPAQFTPTTWTFLPLIVNSRTTCSGPLCNGNFEAGSDGAWSESSAKNWQLIMNLGDYDYLGLSNHLGSYSAWLGGDYSETAVISQQITIPASASSLTFWYWIDSVDSCGFDYAYVEFGGTRLKTYDLCFTQDTGGWKPATIDISAYQGHTGLLSFTVTTDADPDLISNFFLDDITIDSGVAQPSLSRANPTALPPPGLVRRKTPSNRP